ncbi:MAG: DUF1565 domain-containing protein [Planctomycetota bacterium]|nr:MAG: DUF1565 domain-containing protein [Planctomycetota bacterium]
MLSTALLLAIPLGMAQAPVSPQEVFISSRQGDDQSGDGTQNKPFRSIHQALQAQDRQADRPLKLILDIGRYDAEHGEVFPLRLPPGTHLWGWTPEYTLLDGGGTETLLVLEDGSTDSTFRLQSLRLQNAGTAVAAGDGSSRSAIQLQTRDVQIEQCGNAIAGLGSAPGDRADLSFSRFRNCRAGLWLQGSGPLALELKECDFEDNQDGVLVQGDFRSSPSWRLNHCRFRRQKRHGLFVDGSFGQGPAQGLHLVSCQFEGNGEGGLSLTVPAGDTPIRVQACQFRYNRLFGLGLAGRNPGSGTSVVEDCLFISNGVGLHLAQVQMPMQIRRCRIQGNVGNGIFAASSPVVSCRVQVSACLLVENGSSGFYGLSDGLGLQATLASCTIAGNRASGVERRDKHKGSSEFQLLDCLVSDNALNLKNILAEELRHCQVNFFPLDEESGTGNFAGEAAFVNPQAGDYRLKTGSQARRRGIGAPPDLMDRWYARPR